MLSPAPPHVSVMERSTKAWPPPPLVKVAKSSEMPNVLQAVVPPPDEDSTRSESAARAGLAVMAASNADAAIIETSRRSLGTC